MGLRTEGTDHFQIVEQRLQSQADAAEKAGFSTKIPIGTEKITVEKALDYEFATRVAVGLTDEKVLKWIDEDVSTVEVARVPKDKEEAVKPFLEFLAREKEHFERKLRAPKQAKDVAKAAQFRKVLAAEGYLNWLRGVGAENEDFEETEDEVLVIAGALSVIESNAFNLNMTPRDKAALVGATSIHLAFFSPEKREAFWKTLESVVVEDPACTESFRALKRGVEGTVLAAKLASQVVEKYGLAVRLGSTDEDAFRGLDLVIFKPEGKESAKGGEWIYIDLKTSEGLRQPYVFTVEKEGTGVAVRDVSGVRAGHAIGNFEISGNTRNSVVGDGTPAIILRIPENTGSDRTALLELSGLLASAVQYTAVEAKRR